MFSYTSFPNWLTTSRVILTLFAISSYYLGYPFLFFFLILLALFTDFLDGFVSRKLGLSSPLGAVLDPACDKILVALMLSVFYIEGLLSKTFYTLLLMRSFVQMFSFLYVMRWPVSFAIRPNILAKTLNMLMFFLILFFSLALTLNKRSFLWFSDSLFYLLSLLSFFEVFFMIYYPAQFYKILKKEKCGFD